MERSNPAPTSPAEGTPHGRPAPKPHEPAAREVILILIEEELKNRKLFEELRWLSYHNWFYKTNLVDIILSAIGLRPPSTLHRSLCHTLLDKHSQRVVENARELRDEATRVYDALLKHAVQTRLRNGEDFESNTREPLSHESNAGSK